MAIHPDTMRFHFLAGMRFYILKSSAIWGWCPGDHPQLTSKMAGKSSGKQETLGFAIQTWASIFSQVWQSLFALEPVNKVWVGIIIRKGKYLQRPTRTIMGRILHPSTSLFCKDKSMRCSMFQVECTDWSRDFVQCVKNLFFRRMSKVIQAVN